MIYSVQRMTVEKTSWLTISDVSSNIIQQSSCLISDFILSITIKRTKVIKEFLMAEETPLNYGFS